MLRIRVSQLMDFGSAVAIVGVDLDSSAAVVVHIDYRPLTTIEQTWRSGGLNEQVTFAADSLIMRLELDVSGTPDGGIEVARCAA